MIKKLIKLGLLLIIWPIAIMAQTEDLEMMLEAEMGPLTEKANATFLSTYVLNTPSVEMLNKNGINFRISHKFGFLRTGSENAFGFDDASVFSGVEYSPLDGINIGIGKGTYRKSINTSVKIKIIDQVKGAKNIPVTIVAYGELDYRTQHYTNPDLQSNYTGRIEYTTHLLIARKLGNAFALQIMPTYIHRNLVETTEDNNDIIAIGIGSTYRINKTLRINAEYFTVEQHNTSIQDYNNPLALGICWQTSRHAFEVFGTNSTGITSNNNIAHTKGNFFKGDIGIGFNISIIFSTKR